MKYANRIFLEISAVSAALIFSLSAPVAAQEVTDSISTAVFSAKKVGSYLDLRSANHLETINSGGLKKMACCSVADSFENSAAVTVGYADAATGARRIQLLGLSGTYVQTMEESVPVFTGILSPFALTYMPSPWLESIQVSKGLSSVTRGIESISGQINMEDRKPTDERLLYATASVMGDTKTDLNLCSSVQLSDNLSTVVMGHLSGNFADMDMNSDGFLDDPRGHLAALTNRWLYITPGGTQLRFGFKALDDVRHGGQVKTQDAWWFTDIHNNLLGAYFKAGVPVGDASSIALMLEYTRSSMEGTFGLRNYNAVENAPTVSLVYQDDSSEDHTLNLGLRYTGEFFKENSSLFSFDVPHNDYSAGGVFGEYTLRKGDKFTAIGSLYMNLLDYAVVSKMKFGLFPRLTLRYAPNEHLVFRANTGRGLKNTIPLISNIGVLSTSKYFYGPVSRHVVEKAWTSGAGAALTFPLGYSDDATISVDYFHTDFEEQLLVDRESMLNTIAFYSLSSISGARAWADAVQVDFSCEPIRNLTINLSGRYSDSWMPLMGGAGNVRTPMMGLYKGVLGVQYATSMRKWIFDFTASINGPARVYDFMKTDFPTGYTPVYPLFFAQITRRLKGVELYLGGENLGDFRQEKVIFGELSDPSFDASCVWGPIMGRKVYAGVRFTLWKMD